MVQSIAVSARPKVVQEVEDFLIADSPGLTERALDRNPALELADLVLGGDDVEFLSAIIDILLDRISRQSKERSDIVLELSADTRLSAHTSPWNHLEASAAISQSARRASLPDRSDLPRREASSRQPGANGSAPI